MSHGGNCRQFGYYLGNHNHQRPCYLNTEVKINPMATEEKKPVRGNRIIILLIIMIIMICGLAYDWFIARPGCETGFETVQNLVQKNVAASLAEEPITNLSVQKALGKEPATTTTTEDYTIETYRWPRGLVGLSYTVYVIYQPDATGELVVYAPYKNREPPVAELPGYILPKENIVVAKENIAKSIVAPEAGVKPEPVVGEKRPPARPETEPAEPQANPNATAQ